jgi:hypothetical protein
MIFRCIGIWNLCTIDEDCLLSNLLACKVNTYRFGFVGFFRRFFVQIAILFRVDCSFLVEFSTVSPTAMTTVSSANAAMVLFNVVGTSLI